MRNPSNNTGGTNYSHIFFNAVFASSIQRDIINRLIDSIVYHTCRQISIMDSLFETVALHFYTVRGIMQRIPGNRNTQLTTQACILQHQTVIYRAQAQEAG